jgi:galactose oxidase
MKAILATLVLFAPAVHAQGDGGSWEAPFNHVVPFAWRFLQAGWDGEKQSPFMDPQNPHRFLAAHMALIPSGPHRGKLLVMNWMRKDHINGNQYWSIVDVTATPPTFENFALSMPEQDVELFCSGHAWTPRGELLVVGGDRFEGDELKANRLAYRFDPSRPTGNAMWSREPDMLIERWYPTVTNMGTDPDGRDLMLVSGGRDFAAGIAKSSYEAFDPQAPPGAGVWQRNLAAAGQPLFPGPQVPCTDNLGIYPRDFLLTSGRKFSAGMASRGYRVEHTVFGSPNFPRWEVQAPARDLYRWYGTAFLFPAIGGPEGPLADLAFRVGGALVSWDKALCEPDTVRVPVASTELCFAGLDAGDPNWIWRTGPQLAFPRNNPDSTLLPDGTVLVTGGRADPAAMVQTFLPVYEAELLTDGPFQWRTLARAQTRRGYHSVAALLPDGRVLTAGGEQREMDYEIFRPPYLTDGSTRPVIVGAPETLVTTYGAQHWIEHAPLPAGVVVERAVLMPPASVTHHTDMQQRYVELERAPNAPQQVGANTRTLFRMPRNANHAPKGYYMLFLVTSPQGAGSRGTPSEASWVLLQ